MDIYYFYSTNSASTRRPLKEKGKALLSGLFRKNKLAVIFSFFIVFSSYYPISVIAQGTPITPTAGYTDALMYSFTGSDQTFTVPADVTNISVKIWGAGAGGSNAPVIINGQAAVYYSNGGAGGFVAGDIPVTEGETFTIMVGEGGRSDGDAGGTRSYGFGGLAFSSAFGSNGGGLSGIFTNTGAITDESQDRAVMIAGGGGGGELSGSEISVGGQGGDATNAGGATTGTMMGDDNTTVGAGGGGGGGGYTGGRSNQTRLRYTGVGTVTMGEGGANFIAGNVTNGVNEFSPDYVSPFTTNTDGFPPMDDDDQYVAGVGVGTHNTFGQAGNGMVIIQYSVGVTLPVTLSSFTAKAVENKYVSLQWVTATEENSAYFAIERSVDGIHFSEIGRVAAAGNSSATNNYSFKDANPDAGKNYYRLRMVDIDEKEKTSDILVVELSSIGQTLLVYPNPAKDRMTVSGLTNGVQLRIVNSNGHIVLVQKATSNTEKVSVQRLVGGVYILQVLKDGVVQNSTTFVKD